MTCMLANNENENCAKLLDGGQEFLHITPLALAYGFATGVATH
tara:strand:- start:1392 stop:1520 length:129 start_codon:yes stop_codon:yes gene_type:complete